MFSYKGLQQSRLDPFQLATISVGFCCCPR